MISSISTARIVIWLPSYKIFAIKFLLVLMNFWMLASLETATERTNQKILAVGKPVSSVLLIITIRELNEIQPIRLFL